MRVHIFLAYRYLKFIVQIKKLAYAQSLQL